MFKNLKLLPLLAVLGCSAANVEHEYFGVDCVHCEKSEVAPQQVLKADEPGSLTLPPIRVWVSPDVQYFDEVMAGVEAWAFATRGVREWVFVDATAEEIVLGENVAELAIFEVGKYSRMCDGELETNALGCVHGTGGLWNNVSGQPMKLYLIAPQYEQNPKKVTMHEIGHLLGLTHEDGGLMQEVASVAINEADWDCPDPRTVERLEGHLGVDGLTSCPLPIAGGSSQ
jgi:hypothetical protein